MRHRKLTYLFNLACFAASDRHTYGVPALKLCNRCTRLSLDSRIASVGYVGVASDDSPTREIRVSFLLIIGIKPHNIQGVRLLQTAVVDLSAQTTTPYISAPSDGRYEVGRRRWD